jgi:hypothetical protein
MDPTIAAPDFAKGGGGGLAGFFEVADNPAKGTWPGRKQVNLRGNTL